MTKRANDKRIEAAVGRYRRLLRLYPAAFRRANGESMVQLFRDQWREAHEPGRLRPGLGFWGFILVDSVSAASREQLRQLGERLDMTSFINLLGRWPLSVRWTFGVVFVVGLLWTGLVLAGRPTLYRSTARLLLQADNAAESPAVAGVMLERNGHLELAPRVLAAVVNELDLPKAWAGRLGAAGGSDADLVKQRLAYMVQLRRTRVTGLIAIDVRDEDRHEAAVIANKIADVCLRSTFPLPQARRLVVIDPAEPGLRPVQPNVPMIITTGFLASLVGALLITTLMWFARRVRGGSRIGLSASPPV